MTPSSSNMLENLLRVIRAKVSFNHSALKKENNKKEGKEGRKEERKKERKKELAKSLQCLRRWKA